MLRSSAVGFLLVTVSGGFLYLLLFSLGNVCGCILVDCLSVYCDTVTDHTVVGNAPAKKHEVAAALAAGLVVKHVPVPKFGAFLHLFV